MKNKKLVYGILVIVLISLFGVWLSLDDITKCKIVYHKNICYFYAMMDIANNDPTVSDFDEMMNLCKGMSDAPKKDGCFEYVAQTFALIDIEKAQQACNEIKGFDDVKSKKDCLYLIKPLSIADNIYNCNEDNDCVSVKSGCCGCNAGGKNTAINRKYLDYWYSKLWDECREIACIAVMSDHWTCFAEPKCIDGKCQLLPAVEKIAMWQNGEELISDPRSSKHNPRVNNIIRTLHKLNLQATCVFSEEDIQEIKQKDRVVEIVFKNPRDITINQWVQPENYIEGYHLPVNRILRNVKTAIFILEDNLDEGLEGHILVGSEREGKDERCSREITREDLEKLGPCEAVVGYYFDVDKGRCIVISGCEFDSEIVPFKTELQCQATCVGQFIEAQKTPLGWSCWAIQQAGSNELDKSWIDEIRFKGG